MKPGSSSTTDRLLSLVPSALEEHRRAIDATPALNSVTLVLQINRFGPGRDRVLVRTESGDFTKERG